MATQCSRRSCRAHIRLFRQTPLRGKRSSAFVTVIWRLPRWRRFLSYRTAKRRHCRYLYLRCDGPWRPRALITAMMRAMIETHAVEAPDPARLLTQLNSEFTGILKQTGTLVSSRSSTASSMSERAPPVRSREPPTAVAGCKVLAKSRQSSWVLIPPDLR